LQAVYASNYLPVLLVGLGLCVLTTEVAFVLSDIFYPNGLGDKMPGALIIRSRFGIMGSGSYTMLTFDPLR